MSGMLAAGLQTRDVARALPIAARLEARPRLGQRLECSTLRCPSAAWPEGLDAYTRIKWGRVPSLSSGPTRANDAALADRAPPANARAESERLFIAMWR
jgi:hypothetical protein